MDELSTDLGNVADYLHWTWQAAETARQAEIELKRVVAATKKKGATWTELGESLGCSRQAAQQKYGYLVYGEVKLDDL